MEEPIAIASLIPIWQTDAKHAESGSSANRGSDFHASAAGQTRDSDTCTIYTIESQWDFSLGELTATRQQIIVAHVPTHDHNPIETTTMTYDQLRLLGPLRLIALSAAFIPLTIASLVFSLQFGKLTSYGAFQHAWFGRFWGWFGPLSTEQGKAAVEPLLKDAEGVVLDIGPGNGQWLYLFAAGQNSKITKIYGVEPNTEHHKALRESIVRAGLEGVYEILSVGAEDLGTCGIREGSIDTIATVQVLCSVPGPQKIVKALYPYLKPGGRWLVYEHIRTPHRHDLVSSWQGQCNTYAGTARADRKSRVDRSCMAALFRWLLYHSSHR